MPQSDGFRVRRIENDEEVHFVACDEDGPARQDAFAGLIQSVDFERFYVEDTRDDERPEGRGDPGDNVSGTS